MCKVSNWIWKTLDGGSIIFAPAIHTHSAHHPLIAANVLKKMQSTNALGEYLNGNVRMLHIFLFIFRSLSRPREPCVCACVSVNYFAFFSLHDFCTNSHSSHSLSHLTWTFDFEMVSNYHESNIIKSLFHSYAMRATYNEINKYMFVWVGEFLISIKSTMAFLLLTSLCSKCHTTHRWFSFVISK